MNNNKPVAVFDLDDTLIDLKTTLYISLKKEYGDRVPHWSLWDVPNMEIVMGLPQEELIAFANRDKIFRKIEPYTFSSYFLFDLKARGYHIVIITSREGFIENAVQETEEYLEKHRLYYDELIVSPLGKNKTKYLKHYKQIHFAIDDQEGNCDDFDKCGRIEHVLLHAQQHNITCQKYPRIHTLYQILKHVGLE